MGPRLAPKTTTPCSSMPGLRCRRACPAHGDCLMRKHLLAQIAALAATMAGPALAADMPLAAPAPFAARFNWTSCYLGGHGGGGFCPKETTHPGEAGQD